MVAVGERRWYPRMQAIRTRRWFKGLPEHPQAAGVVSGCLSSDVHKLSPDVHEHPWKSATAVTQ